MVTPSARPVYHTAAPEATGGSADAGVVAIIPVGPREADAIRTARVVDSLARHETGLRRLILLIDGVTEAALRPHVRQGPIPVQYLPNARAGRGSGIYDGLACGLTAVFATIAAELPGAHVWKIDTDALVLRPTGRQIAAFLNARPGVGLAGTYQTEPGGGPRHHDWRPGIDVAKKFLRPVWYWRTEGKWRSRLIGRNRLYAKWMRDAHAAGLPWGWHVQGGSYAVSGRMLAAWQKSGRLSDPEIWLGAPMSEDVGFSHWARIDDFAIADFNAPGEAFGVSAIGLPMPIDRLVAANYGVVHSLKMGDWAAECAVADELIRRTSNIAAAVPAEPLT